MEPHRNESALSADFARIGLSAVPKTIRDQDAARALVTHWLLQELAPLLGLEPEKIDIRADADAESRTNAYGASGLMAGETIYLHPGRYHPGTTEGRYLLAHEITHAAQRRLTGKPDFNTAEKEAAEIGRAFATRLPLQRPSARLAEHVVAADTGAVPEPPFETTALQNHESELARIRQLLHGLWISDGDVDKVLLILKSLPPPTALTLIRELKSDERVDLVDNMHGTHRKNFRTEVLICYRALTPSEIGKFDEDLFDDMELSEPVLGIQEAYTVAEVVKNLGTKAKALRTGKNSRAIAIIEQFAADPDNRSRWEIEVGKELNKAWEEERELAKTREEAESIWLKDQSQGGKLETLVKSIRERLSAWIVTDKDALGILNDLAPYAHDMPAMRAIADRLVAHSYEKKDGEYAYKEDKDYLQELIDQIPMKALYEQNSPHRKVFLQLLLARPGYKSIESVLKLTDEVNIPLLGMLTGFFSYVDSEEAYLAYQLVRSMPPRARRAVMEFDGGDRWSKITSNLSVSQREGDTTNFYQGGKNSEDRDAILTQLLLDEVWAQAERLRGVVGMAIAAGHYDWVFAESQRRYEAAKSYGSDDVAAVVETYKLYNPGA